MKNIFLILLMSVSCLSFAKESAEFADKVIQAHGLTGEGAATLKRLLMNSTATRNIGTEDPSTIFGTNHAVHPASRQACIDRVLKTGLIRPNQEFERTCGAKWMSPIPTSGGIETAKVCIDQFEFPDMPCEYPVVWAPSAFAKQVCGAMGKRVCNSHEWEGACAGHVDTKDPYLFSLGSLPQRRAVYNQNREKTWAFSWNPKMQGKTTRDLCATYNPNDPDLDPQLRGRTSQYYTPVGKSPACQQTKSDYANCGSHTWPAGLKYDCRTQNDVFDMHGNVAEVMNFPTSPAGLATPSHTDKTERKGSFFVIRNDYPDDCRVRQPYEHFEDYATGKMAFYQEGFRCCKDIE